MNNDQSTTQGSRRLLIWSLLGLLLLTALAGFIAALPAIAPQLVIAHSPWIWPVLRAEAYETEGKEPDLFLNERHNLVDRLYNEENWEQAAVPVLTRALEHPDLRMRRTAANTLFTLRPHHADSTPIIWDGELVAHLRRLLDDADDEVFQHAFGLLLNHEDSVSAQAILDHFPRECGIVPTRLSNSLDSRLSIFFGSQGEPHPLRHLRLGNLVQQAQRWLATNDPSLVRIALMTLGFSHDPRALPILDAHLGKHLETEEYWDGWDPVSYALSLSPLPGVNNLLTTAMADEDPLRRRKAAGILGSRADTDTSEISLALLRAHIDDLDAEVRNQVANSLVNFPLVQTLPDLRHIITRGGQPAVTAIDCLRFNRMSLHRSRPWWGRGVVVPSIDPDTPENWALEARIIAEFSTLTTHPEPAVRFELARYLCSTWEPDTERVLRSMADDADPQVRAEVAAELQAITNRTRRDPATYRTYATPTNDEAPLP
jgi:hypothetical protein